LVYRLVNKTQTPDQPSNCIDKVPDNICMNSAFQDGVVVMQNPLAVGN
jgi:hypothetical protein